MTHTTELYFESHVTIDPVSNYQVFIVDLFAKLCGFKVAELLKVNGQVSDKDQFMSSRDTDYDELLDRTLSLVACLQKNGYRVRRYKIENTLLDVKF